MVISGPVSKLTLKSDETGEVSFEYSDGHVLVKIAYGTQYIAALVPREAWGRVARGETDR